MISADLRRKHPLTRYLSLLRMGFVFGLISIFPLPSLLGIVAARDTIPPAMKLPPAQAVALEQTFGIQVMALRLSSNGLMIDFRYKIIDAEKSLPLMDERIKPYLIDDATGKKFFVPSHPKVGSMRALSSKPLVDRVYYILFSNPGQSIKVGNTVTVVIGDIKIENLNIL